MLKGSAAVDCENTPVFASAKQMAINSETDDIFQKSGLSKFAAATVRLSELKRDAEKSHLTASANAKNDVSFTAQAPRGFIVNQEDANYAESEWASK